MDIYTIQRELCGRNRIHVCLRLCVRACVRVYVRMCVSAFPSQSLIKATLKSSGASAVQPLHLFFRLPYMPPWSIILTVYTLEISLEAYVPNTQLIQTTERLVERARFSHLANLLLFLTSSMA